MNIIYITQTHTMLSNYSKKAKNKIKLYLNNEEKMLPTIEICFGSIKIKELQQ